MSKEVLSLRTYMFVQQKRPVRKTLDLFVQEGYCFTLNSEHWRLRAWSYPLSRKAQNVVRAFK